MYLRYLKLNPLAREDFVEYLRKVDQLDEAAKQLANLVRLFNVCVLLYSIWENADTFISLL